MTRPIRTACLALALAIGAPAMAQIVQASGYATINVAGIGNTTTVAGESRIPILSRNVSFDLNTSHLRVLAVGHRGPVRELTIDLPQARAGQRYDLGGSGGASLHVRMDNGAELIAQSGQGNVTLTTLDPRVTGTYEGTFSNGAVPVVVRGRFEANLPGPAGTPTNP